MVDKVNVSAEKFYLKVGETILSRGAEFGLKPDGLVTNSEAEKIEAERILNENIGERHEKHRKVFNSTIGDLLPCLPQIDGFKCVKAQSVTQQNKTKGASMQQAGDVA